VFILLNLVSKTTKKSVNNLGYLRQKQHIVYKAAIILYFSISVIILLRSGVLSNGHWYRTKSAFMEQSGSLAVIALYLIWGLRFLIVSFTFELLDLKAIRLPQALFITVIICGYELMFVGNRIVVVMFGIAGFIYIARRYGRSALFFVLLLILPVALMLALYQNIRHLLFTASPLETFQSLYSLTKTAILGEQFWDAFLTIFEYVDFVVVMKLFSDVGDLINPLGGYTLLKIFTWFIPRSIWSSKPASIDLLIGDMYLPDSGVSFVGLLFGEIHFNFGNFGVLILPFLLLAVLLLLSFIRKQIPINFYWGLLVGFLMFRMPVSNIILISAFSLLSYKFIEFSYLILKTIITFKISYQTNYE
jgi:hypothetical protein